MSRRTARKVAVYYVMACRHFGAHEWGPSKCFWSRKEAKKVRRLVLEDGQEIGPVTRVTLPLPHVRAKGRK